MVHRKTRNLILALGAALCFNPAAAQAVKVSRMTYVMGTLLQVQVTANDKKKAEEAMEAAFREIERWDGLLSNYKETSEIARLNRDAHPDAVAVSPDVVRFLTRARDLGEATNGFYDITVEPLTRLWKIRERTLPAPPNAESIARARARVDFRNVEIDPASGTVRFRAEGMGLDTGGIGKGYALDRALEEIRQYPVQAAVLNFGGEILSWSQKPRERKVSVKDPLHPDRIWADFFISTRAPSAACSTSADYERFVVLKSTDARGETKTSHILNPKSGEPARGGIRSVTVLSARADEADAFSTAVFAMGLKEAERFCAALEKTGVLILYEDSDGALKSYASASWKEWIQPEKEITNGH